MDAHPTGLNRRIFIVGGSNSILRNGWTYALADALGPDQPITNLSCGAASTLMGLFRFLGQIDQCRPGDVVIWEYALNDQNHCSSGQSWQVLVRYVKWMIRLCHDHGLLFLPLVLHQRSWHNSTPPTCPYYRALENLFQAAGIKAVSDEPIIRARIRGGQSIDKIFADPVHLRNGPKLMAAFARDIVAALSGLEPLGPKALQASIPQPGATLTLATDFAAGETLTFKNSIVNLIGHPIQQSPGLTCKGKLLGLIVVTGTARTALELKIGSQVIGPISTQAFPAHVSKQWILKQIAVEGQFPKTPILAEGAITIRTATPRWRRPYVQNTYVWSPVKPGQNGAETRPSVVAALIETGVPHHYEPPKLLARIKLKLRNTLRRLANR
ncbi:SGNH/GDSL hydrolase family protein [Neogemmobacter tilapiae]|uniref:Uncharacterized protein n=1 Tax=Neogemmobacter tilapiae TaxID=875041 RepID=A0A918TP22_9RHOB|nr:hypothetical protein [Gemmobacter tilapiae]GHC53239.1 hypothetical protein GCM10007315_14850 [Gemmobacter tilapiae]